MFLCFYCYLKLEKVIINDIEYIHGSWIRELNLNEKNKWIQPINNIDDICWTIIASKPYNPTARRSQNTSFIDTDSVEIHSYIGQKKMCNNDIRHFSNKIADDGMCLYLMHIRSFSELLLILDFL